MNQMSATTRRYMMPMPNAPRSLDEVGVDREFLLDLLIKTVYRNNLQQPSKMAEAIALGVPLVEQLISKAKELKLIETMGQREANLSAEMRYALTEAGRQWALKALALSEWVGPCPVPLEQFRAQAKEQSVRGETLTRKTLERQFAELTLPESLMHQIGPAVNSAQSILLYGPPGNGKSSIADAVCLAYDDVIYIPHALIVDNQVIALFDSTVHRPAKSVADAEDRPRLRAAQPHDPRYVPCHRPIVSVGGELTLDMMDLAYNPVSRVYEAPLQLKAAGGILVVDDFGRQRQKPQELMNRLIVPLEKNIDFLSLQTGRKFDVPYDALTMFSTNINPKSLVDDAALRRLRYKIRVESPDLERFVAIFYNVALRFDLKLTEEVMEFILFELYAKQEGAQYQAFHPRFLVDQVIAICRYEGVNPKLEPEYLRRAWGNLFTQE